MASRGSTPQGVGPSRSPLYLVGPDPDWAGMAHGVEIRVPLVDVELLRRVAPGMLRPGQTAAWGKQALAGAPRRGLPEAVRLRAKTGFTVPFHDWIGRIDGLDVWKREPALAHRRCHWSRRLAYALGQDLVRRL
jgi:asparagine synthase (glutamine-hydrolysing)